MASLTLDYKGRSYTIEVVKEDIETTLVYSVYLDDKELVKLVGNDYFLIWLDEKNNFRYTTSAMLPEAGEIKEMIKDAILNSDELKIK